MRRSARQAFWGFGISILILCIVNIITFRTIQSLALTEEDRSRSFRLMTALQKVESELKDADTAQHGFLLTSDPVLLEPYRISLQNYDKNFQTLRALTSNNHPMSQDVAELEKLVQAKHEDMRQSIETRGRVGFDAAVQIVIAGKGNQIMEDIRAELSELITRQNQRLQARDEQVRKEADSAKFAMLLGTSAAVFVTIFAAYMIRVRLREREYADNLLKAAHQDLELKVLERTADLESANVQLQDEVKFRHKTELALEKQRHFLRAVLDSLDEGVVACDADGRVILVNDITRQFLGLPDGELSASSADWRVYYNAVMADGESPIKAEEAPLHRAMRGDVVNNEEIILTAHNGQRRIILASAQQIIVGNNERLGAVVALRDITELKKNERAIQAQQTAEASNRAKSEFLSRMSHELRTPLNAILGFAQLMQMDTLPPQHLESVEQILKGGRHLLSLINEVLDISRIEAGRLAISPEPVLLSEAVSEVVSLVSPIAGQKNIEIDFTCCTPHERHVRADRQRIKQVLLNLLSNAVKYNRVGGSIQITCEEGNESSVRISVSDSGAGISPENLPRLFTPFDRLDADKSGVEGTGLGLSLSKGLIELMGGRMGVESSPDNGSTFWFELAETEAPTGMVGPFSVSENNLAGAAAHSTATVLYIEDNASNIRLVEQILKQRPGVTLIFSMEGQPGIELAHVHRPDLIYLDLNLPDINGSEVLRQLKADPVTENIPVVVLSADATPGQIERLRTAGARNYLTKPINVQEFLREFDSISQTSEQSS